MKRKYTFQDGGEMEQEPQQDNFYSGLLSMMEQGIQADEKEAVQQEYTEERTGEPEDEFITNLRGYDEEQQKINEEDRREQVFQGYMAKMDERMQYLQSQSDEQDLFPDDPDEVATNYDTRNNATPYFSSPTKGSGVTGNEKQAYQFFINKGYAPHIAAGIVGNIKHESNFNAGAVGDGGKARGYAQWHPDRYGPLSQKFDLSTTNGNLEAIDYELRNSERGAFDALQQARTPEEAAQIFDRKYERSAGLSTRERMQSARQIYTN